jgi:GntR family transcriptional regulator/MocR family aminotransferase
MQKTWATSESPGPAGTPPGPRGTGRRGTGSDLHLELAPGRPVRRALEDALRAAIQAGRLAPGARLPSSRALAADLGLARNTVADAYGQLIAEGWLAAARGSGTRVAGRVVARPASPPPAPDPAAALRHSLLPGTPDLSAFPASAWLAAARRALATAPSSALGYADPRGQPELRQALAEYLARARGVRADPEHLLICAGFTQALALLTRVLAARGATTMAVEAYGHRHHRQVVTAAGLSVRPVPVDAGGVMLAGLDGAQAALLTPAHQFPTGVPLAAARRTRAAGWAAETGATIIEDDYDGEFRYDRQAVGAMQALAPGSVVYAGTASKTLAPALRLAWLAVPPGLTAELTAARELADRHGPVLDQLTLAGLLRSGGYDRHVRRCRLSYRRRREYLAAALREQVPGARLAGVAAGLHAVVELPAGRAEDEVIAAAAARGLAVAGLSEFAAGDGAPRARPALVVGFAAPAPSAFTTAIARLCAVLAPGAR